MESGASGEVETGSDDDTYAVAIFNFATPAQAMAFYTSPPGAIPGFVGGALGYAPLTSSTASAAGVMSKGVDMRSCSGEGSGPTLTPSGGCSNGGASFSVGAAQVLTAGTVVLMVAWLSGTTNPQGSASDLAKLAPYVTGAQTLLASH